MPLALVIRLTKNRCIDGKRGRGRWFGLVISGPEGDYVVGKEEGRTCQSVRIPIDVNPSFDHTRLAIQ